MKMRRGQFDLNYLIYLAAALVLLLLIKLLTPPPPPPVNIAGTWNGTWNLAESIGPFSASGPKTTFILDIQEDSSGNIWGRISFPGNTMFSTNIVSGTVSGNNINFTFSSPMKTVSSTSATTSSTSGSSPMTLTGNFSFSGVVSPGLNIMNGSLGVNIASAVGFGIFSLSGPSISVNGDWNAYKQ